MFFIQPSIFRRGRSFIFRRGLVIVLILSTSWHCKSPARPVHADITYDNGSAKPRTVTLPDSSTIVMSPHTVVRISREFNKSERDLELDGEAIFTVNDDAGKPFVVHTKNLRIEVLGTRFRVEAFANTAGEEVDLLSGKLRVKKSYHSDTDNEPETLGAGEMVMINRDIDLMEKEKLDSAEWKTLQGRW